MEGPTWTKDIIPYFLPVYIYIFSHIIYYLSGNMMISVWLMFVLNPVMTYIFDDAANERPNIHPSLEKKYMEDKRFLIPLYLYIIVDTLTHIWALCVVST
jgi:alkane 1-monooxygenase